MKPWTKQDEGMLERLWLKEGLSASLVGQKLGRSRSSILGQAKRMGLRKPRSQITHRINANTGEVVKHFAWTEERETKLKLYCAQSLSWDIIGYKLGIAATTATKRAGELGIEKKPAIPASWGQQLKPRTRSKARKFQPESLKVHKPDRKAEGKIGVLDLKPGMCRWPVGDPLGDDFSFCGDQCAKGSSYCTEHKCCSVEER